LPLRQFDIKVFRASPVSFCVPACVLQDFIRSCCEFVEDVWAIAAGVISVASAMIATAIAVRMIDPLVASEDQRTACAGVPRGRLGRVVDQLAEARCDRPRRLPELRSEDLPDLSDQFDR